MRGSRRQCRLHSVCSIAYVIAFIGLSSSSGIAYGDWFVSGENAFRTAVIPLIGGSLVLIIFLWWARWDFVFTDSARLPMYGILTVGVVLLRSESSHLIESSGADPPVV